MAIVTTNDKYYKEIANIIRWKSNLNKTDTYTPDRMASKIFYNIGGGEFDIKIINETISSWKAETTSSIVDGCLPNTEYDLTSEHKHMYSHMLNPKIITNNYTNKNAWGSDRCVFRFRLPHKYSTVPHIATSEMPSPKSNFNKTEYCYGYTIYKISYINPFNKTQQESVLISDMGAFSTKYSDTLPSMAPIGASITYYGTSQFSQYTKSVPWFAMYITSTYNYMEEGHQLIVMVGSPSRWNELGFKYISPSSITCIAIIYNKTYRQYFKEDTSIDTTDGLTLDYNKIYDNMTF